MSRTKKGKKGPGYEYWGKRAGGKMNGRSPGKDTKTRTSRIERKDTKRLVRKIKDVDPEC